MVLEQLGWAILLTAACVLLHGVCTFGIIHRAHVKTDGRKPHIYLRWYLFTEMIVALLLLHAVEAAFWANFFVWKKGMPNFSAGLYFSVTSFSTIGYGDLTLPESLRLVGAFEGLVGTLLTGWSVALIVAMLQVVVVPGIHSLRREAKKDGTKDLSA